jgi:peroxiredoxin
MITAFAYDREAAAGRLSCTLIPLALAACLLLASTGAAAATATVGKPPPPFALRDEEGVIHRITDHVGSPTIVYFTHNVCHYCGQVIAFLGRAHQRYADRGLVILSINVMADGAEMIRRYKEQYGLPFVMLAGKEPELLRNYEVNYVPILIFIDRDGIVSQIYHHYILPEDFDAAVEHIVTGQ